MPLTDFGQGPVATIDSQTGDDELVDAYYKTLAVKIEYNVFKGDI